MIKIKQVKIPTIDPVIQTTKINIQTKTSLAKSLYPSKIFTHEKIRTRASCVSKNTQRIKLIDYLALIIPADPNLEQSFEMCATLIKFVKANFPHFFSFRTMRNISERTETIIDNAKLFFLYFERNLLHTNDHKFFGFFSLAES